MTTRAPEHPIRVLFLCTGNSCRSQLAEAILRRDGGADFEVFSAGTEPKGVNPYTLRVLADTGIDWSQARSKSVKEYLDDSFDYVVTVCDSARQACPVFPGTYQSVHWDLEDPAEVDGTDAEKLHAFRATFLEQEHLIGSFVEVARRAAGRPDHATVFG